MICVLAMVVFAFMGIFSARYRKLAKEAFRCTFLKLTFKPCDSKLDQRIKSKITSKLMPKHPKGAKFMYKHFDAISYVFVLIFFLSMAYTGYAVYNLAVHGSCTPENPDACVFTPEAEGCAPEPTDCAPCLCDDLTCESPDYVACEGNCSCREEMCPSGGQVS